MIYPDHPILDGPLVQCEACALVQVNPPRRSYQIADAAGAETHAGAYARQTAAVQTHLHYDPAVEDAERAVRERVWRDRLRRIERVKRGGRLLEIGADGQFLRLAAESGWSSVGVQPETATCTRAAELYGVQLQPTTLADARFPDQSFDVVVIFHVLEHVPSPRQLCSEIFRILRPGGLLFVETPNVETLWFRILGRRWRQLIPDHYWFFSPATLRGLLERVGFVVDAVEPGRQSREPATRRQSHRTHVAHVDVYGGEAAQGAAPR